MRGEPSARNTTVPVGVPAPGETGATVTAKSTSDPVRIGLAEAEIIRLTAALLAGVTITVAVLLDE